MYSIEEWTTLEMTGVKEVEVVSAIGKLANQEYSLKSLGNQ